MKRRRIEKFKAHISMKYDEKNEEHERLLELLWKISFGAQKPFERKCKAWGKLGFQGVDPQTDFRGAGFKGLSVLVFFAHRYGEKYRQMVAGRSKEALENYPVAIASFNVIMLLYEVMGWGMKKVQVEKSSRETLLQLLFGEDREWSFYEGRDVEGDFLFEKLFSLTFFLLDEIWLETNANYMQFPTVLEKTSVKLQSLLSSILTTKDLDLLLQKYE